ncbi:protein spaetzle 5 [Bacillus rossius redtenbacheri]|uniref:protein spaetzle 5 n=1 Tax=Bacillus rossius redtenbacheri TaxID=93214 RepID=UPI002FDE9A45
MPDLPPRLAPATMLLGLVALLALLLVARASPQCDHYGGCRHHFPFVPAPPGKTPPCAKPGATFCEKIDSYPTQLIRYLIERWGYDYSTLFTDESRDDFNYRSPAAYGPLRDTYSPHVPHLPKLSVPVSYYPLLVPANTSGHAGYPDRRYKLYTSPLLYTALLQPSLPQYSPDDWWTRYARSNTNSEGNNGVSSSWNLSGGRKRRQAAGSGNQNTLCPTTTSFVTPKAAMNKEGNWMYVVNVPEVDDRYTQLVGTETCVSNQCNGLCTIPNGYTSRCEQQFVQKRLVALEGGGNNLYTDVFWFPHCCVCQITQNNG